MAAAVTSNSSNPMAANARYSLPAGRNGAVGGGGSPRPGSSSGRLPHIDDLVAIPPDIDANVSIKRLLELAQASLHTAQISRDFNRLDQAMKEFIRASVIIIHVIPQHKDFTLLSSSHKDLNNTWTSLRDKTWAENDSFVKVKEEIKKDNLRTGVRPTAKRAALGQSQESMPLSSRASVDASSQSRASVEKTKPAIRPKPPALHGNATASKNGVLSSDLLDRFKGLGGPQPKSSPGQDPRIKTHPPPAMPKPSGPRAMPRPEKLKLDSSASFPKMPDAIYSPARTNATGEAARIPPSTPRTAFPRTNSMTSLAGQQTTPQPNHSEYFAPPQRNNGDATKSSARSSYDMDDYSAPSNATSISAKQLVEKMKDTETMLLIDVREREMFDEGHILHSNIICIEPSILMRKEISGDDIEDSLVVSPADELEAFKRRHEVDVVVFYDQDTDSITRRRTNSDDLALHSLHRALVDLSYRKELKQPPIFLQGGINAWVDLLGPSSLQGTTDVPKKGRPSRSLSKYVPRNQEPTDIARWQNKVDQEKLSYAHTTDAFLRRYPDLPKTSQSMTSSTPVPPRAQPPQFDTLPQAPAPAVPRPWYSSSTHGTNEFPAPAEDEIKPLSRTRTLDPSVGAKQYLTGLSNPHNWCYANSLFQCLAASPGFGTDLADSRWIKEYVVPRRANEKIDQPQLMTRIISNLFHWMNSGKLQTMQAKTLMDYSRHVCTQNLRLDSFGDNQQHDADEFRHFIVDNIAEETNIHRDRPMGFSFEQSGNLITDSGRWWTAYKTRNDSLMDKYWSGAQVDRRQCQSCGDIEYSYIALQHIVAYHDERCHTLRDAFNYSYLPEVRQSECDRCKKKGKKVESRIARMPQLFCVVIQRAAEGGLGRDNRRLTWDFNDMDFSDWFMWSEQRRDSAAAASAAQGDPALELPFRYECYAVISHTGSSLNQGHYTAYVRDTGSRDPYAWIHCDDARVSTVRIGGGGRDDIKERVYGSGHTVPYILFFRRISGRGDTR